MNNKIRKLQFGDYFQWNNLSREDKVKRNKQIAKQYLDKGPSIQNYYNALKAYFGGFNPKNPYLQTGEPIILPGMNPTKGVQTVAKAVRTLEDYLKTTKVTAPALEGSSMARSAYATDRYIGGRMFQNTLPEEAMKIQGHGMAKSPTIQDALARLRYILDNGIKGKFYTAPLKVSKEAAMAGEAIGTGGATPYFDGHFLITGKPGQMINSVDDIGTIYINDAYENEEALKAAQKMKEYLTKTYPNKVFKLYSEGFKKGGSIKLTNARKWKHKEDGIIKAAAGTQVNTNTSNSKKFDWKPILTNVGTNLLNLGLQTFAQNDKINQETEERISDIKSPNFFDTYIEALQKAQQDEKQKLKAIEAMTGTVVNYSPIAPSNTAFKAAALMYGKQKEEADAKKAAIEAQAKASKASNIQNGIFGLLQNGIGLVTDYYNNKSSNNNTSSNNSNSSSTFGNYVGTQFKNYGTFNLDGSMNMG